MNAPATTRRERLRQEAVAEIKEAALAQIREGGPASITLRAVARRAGMSAPNLYRYFDSLDTLVTALIVEGFDSLADALEGAVADVGAGDERARLTAAALAYRSWSLAHPEEFALLFGDPIPGYHAPDTGETTRAARRQNAVFVPPFASAWRRGALAVPGEDELGAPLAAQLRQFATDRGIALPPGGVALLLSALARLHGLVSLEVFGHFAPMIGDAEALFRHEIAAMLTAFGLGPPG